MDSLVENDATFPTYEHSHINVDPAHRAIWHYMDPQPRPCFTTTLLREIREVQARAMRHAQVAGANSIRYLVLASAIPSVYNLGGDLDKFARLIRAQDHETLRSYAHLCIDCVWGNVARGGISALTTIALVQGQALGGGFEAALSCNVLIAERSAMFSFPEILFNLFPGMGAYSLLARRISQSQTERMIKSAKQYSAAELHELGVVDVLAEDGQGVVAVHEFIRRHSRQRNALEAVQRVRERVNPLTRAELIDIADMWVEAAMRITERDLRTMLRLTGRQTRLLDDTAGAGGPQSVPLGAHPRPEALASA